MSYQGALLSGWFKTEPIDDACEGMAKEGGRRQASLVARNTPVDTRHLRESIEAKLMVVYVNALGEKVYESGSETNVEYAPYVEEGTGLYGPRHAYYIIRAKKPHGYLRFIDQATGEPVFAKQVRHPGSVGQHMFAIGVALSEHEFDAFSAVYVARCMERLERQNHTFVVVRGRL